MSTVGIPKRIVELMVEHGSLQNVAKATGIDVGYLSRLASGKQTAPGVDTLERLGLRRVVTYRRMVELPERLD